ncbi:hypothetical protein RB195_006985 [Necator americanus]|uniref:Peptidase C1A papain C-terminal domain-containing protein n=1 Tax=Necator americanus TaxID=51031 RepID=A0ABR1BXN1_NECAM
MALVPALSTDIRTCDSCAKIWTLISNSAPSYFCVLWAPKGARRTQLFIFNDELSINEGSASDKNGWTVIRSSPLRSLLIQFRNDYFHEESGRCTVLCASMARRAYWMVVCVSMNDWSVTSSSNDVYDLKSRLYGITQKKDKTSLQPMSKTRQNNESLRRYFKASLASISDSPIVSVNRGTLYADELLHKQESEHGLSGQALVDYVNSHQSLFKAEYSPTNEQFVKARIMDIKYMTEASHKYPRKGINLNVELPERFDAREKWPHCASIGLIRDQSACGSCWAVSAASVMSDRLCIQTNGTNQKILSSADILACCGEDCGSGCEGGYPIQAYFYLENTGVCSGGEYREKNVCKPYPFYPCDGNYGPCPKEGAFDTPKCRKICQFRYPVPYEEDKVFGESVL